MVLGGVALRFTSSGGLASCHTEMAFRARRSRLTRTQEKLSCGQQRATGYEAQWSVPLRRQRSWTHQKSRAEVRASARGSISRRARVAWEQQVCRTYEEITHNGCSCVRFPRTGRTLTPCFGVHLFWRADSFKYKRAATHLYPGWCNRWQPTSLNGSAWDYCRLFGSGPE